METFDNYFRGALRFLHGDLTRIEQQSYNFLAQYKGYNEEEQKIIDEGNSEFED
jgi:hypothetical protein